MQFDPAPAVTRTYPELHGVKLEADDYLLCWLSAPANRDEDVFVSAPGEFDAARAKNPATSRSASAAHYCLGANPSHGSRRAWPSRRCSGGCPGFGSPWSRTSSSGGRRPASGGSRRFRSPGRRSERLDDEREAVHLADDDLVARARA